MSSQDPVPGTGGGNGTNSSASVSASSMATTGVKSSSGDMGWNWAERRDPTDANLVWCLLCNKRMSGGINRVKKHLAHRGNDVKGCDKVTLEIQKQVRASLDEYDRRKVQKNRQRQILQSNPNELDEGDSDEAEEDNRGTLPQHESGMRKRVRSSDVRGPLDSVLKPDLKKVEQARIDKKDPYKEKLKMIACEG